MSFHETLHARWMSLWYDIVDMNDADRRYLRTVGRDLLTAYASGGRHYHTAFHLHDCFVDFDPARRLLDDPAAVELALWFHDACYNTHRRDNEERSAAWAGRVCERMGRPAAFTSRVRELILATRHAGPATDRDLDTQVLIDIDLGIFGRPLEFFERYDRAIRREYAWVPDAVYRAKRAEILRGFLARDSIYATHYFHDRYEHRARKNIRLALLRLAVDGAAP